MRRLIFALLTSGTFACAGGAQEVPGRDLLAFPIGLMAEAPALGFEAGDGLWNPATALLPRSERARVGVGALTTSPAQGAAAQTAFAMVALPDRTTVGLSLVHAGVDDIARTDGDPQTAGNDLAYNTLVLSAVAARRTHRHIVTGIGVRYRSGALDQVRRSVFGLDGGAVVGELGPRHARVGLSTYLWQPADGSAHANFNGSADFRVAGDAPSREVRAGYSLSAMEGLGREHYLSLAGTFGKLTGRAGLLRAVQLGEASTRFRLGLGLHYARYRVGFARNEEGAGLGAAYGFSLSATL